jgi:hypothetical protein
LEKFDCRLVRDVSLENGAIQIMEVKEHGESEQAFIDVFYRWVKVSMRLTCGSMRSALSA